MLKIFPFQIFLNVSLLGVEFGEQLSFYCVDSWDGTRIWLGDKCL